jgi:hypothetical protein
MNLIRQERRDSNHGSSVVIRPMATFQIFQRASSRDDGSGDTVMLQRWNERKLNPRPCSQENELNRHVRSSVAEIQQHTGDVLELEWTMLRNRQEIENRKDRGEDENLTDVYLVRGEGSSEQIDAAVFGLGAAARSRGCCYDGAGLAPGLLAGPKGHEHQRMCSLMMQRSRWRRPGPAASAHDRTSLVLDGRREGDRHGLRDEAAFWCSRC